MTDKQAIIENYIFGNVEEKYNLNKNADGTYTVADMLEIVHPLDL